MNRAVRRQVERELARRAREAPAWLADQMDAASREIRPLVVQLGGAIDGTYRPTPKDVDQARDQARDVSAVLHLAAGTRITRTCPHAHDILWGRPRPLLVHLGSRDAACLECVQSGRFRLRPHVDDGLCDVCNLPAPGGLFTSFVIDVGGEVFLGDVGECCGDALGLG